MITDSTSGTQDHVSSEMYTKFDIKKYVHNVNKYEKLNFSTVYLGNHCKKIYAKTCYYTRNH